MQTIIHGDCLIEMRKMADNSIDAIVCDPPYFIGFMGKDFDNPKDNISCSIEIWAEALRICKPGAWMLAAGSPRTHHRLMCAIEDAGWYISDVIMHIHGQGFPKGKSQLKPAYEPWILSRKKAKKVLPLQIDACRIQCLTGQLPNDIISEKGVIWELEKYLCNSCAEHVERIQKQEALAILEYFVISNAEQITTESVKKYLIDTGILGIGCLDILFQGEQKKKLNIDLFLNMLKSGKMLTEKNQLDMLYIILTMIHGTTELKICSLCKEANILAIIKTGTLKNIQILKREELSKIQNKESAITRGRFPSNLILDEIAGKLLDQQSGNCASPKGNRQRKQKESNCMSGPQTKGNFESYGDSGGASRFFYCAKSSTAERQGSKHPTIKPKKLIGYLVKLVCPPNSEAIVLDPFMGSGTCGVCCKELGINFIGIEKELDYFKDAENRLSLAKARTA